MLINVLSVLALASAVMVTILTLQDVSIERSTRYMDASSAAAYALGGEASAVVALRRDARDASETDHYAEAWTSVADESVQIDGGMFSLSIEDEQSRFNLNNLLTDGLGAEELLRSLLLAMRAQPGLASVISAYVIRQRGIKSLDDLVAAGIDPSLVASLAEVACALPSTTDVNINTASEGLLSIMLGNRAAAKLLVAKRERQGFLVASDLASARVLLPARSGYRSDYYAMAVKVTFGTVTQSLTSHLHRKRSDDGRIDVKVWRRSKNTAARLPKPPQQN
ncbi:MAG: hypothetical protein EOO82_03435 [Oxalobacteraceae bacterium]|nr:MAG: hypothetical protein EOO82_03435 [Oxalobacteraceae bacterium]